MTLEQLGRGLTFRARRHHEKHKFIGFLLLLKPARTEVEARFAVRSRSLALTVDERACSGRLRQPRSRACGPGPCGCAAPGRVAPRRAVGAVLEGALAELRAPPNQA